MVFSFTAVDLFVSIAGRARVANDRRTALVPNRDIWKNLSDYATLCETSRVYVQLSITIPAPVDQIDSLFGIDREPGNCARVTRYSLPRWDTSLARSITF